MKDIEWKKQLEYGFIKVSKDSMGFPITIPIEFDNLKLGNIKIDFDLNFKEKISLSRTVKKRIYVEWLLEELFEFMPLLEKDVLFTLRMEKESKKKLASFVFFSSYLPPNSISKERQIKWYDYILDEKDFFELLKCEGPNMLCFSSMQNKMIEWLSDKKIFGRRINQLRDSLEEYAYRFRPLPAGRPRKDMIQKLGQSGVKEMHKHITLIFRIAKDNAKVSKYDSIHESIDRAGREFLQRLNEKITNSTKVLHKEIKILHCYSWLLGLHHAQKTKFLSVISNPIAEDENLRAEFETFTWEPNKFALEVMGKMLDARPNTIHKLVYGQKNKNNSLSF